MEVWVLVLSLTSISLITHHPHIHTQPVHLTTSSHRGAMGAAAAMPPAFATDALPRAAAEVCGAHQ
jgi:hypothetical protein